MSLPPASESHTRRLVRDLEGLASEQEVLLRAEAWETLDECTSRAALLTQHLVELVSQTRLSVEDSGLRSRVSQLIERHEACVTRLLEARETVRLELDSIERLRSTAAAVLPRYQQGDAAVSAGARLSDLA
jgi:hypothetical protein